MSILKKQKKGVVGNTPISVNEFRSWISGVEDMQGDDWFPTQEQWIKIRNKITLLQESNIAQVPTTNNLHSPCQPIYQHTLPDQQWPTNTTGTALNNEPVSLYSEIDLSKTPDVIAGDYSPAFI